MSAGLSPVVELRNVTVRHGSVVVLEDVNLTVDRAHFAAIIGPNGAGKTTLLRVILGLVEPSSGEVLVFGKHPGELGSERTRIGYVPQMSSIDLRFPVTVFETVLMGTYGKLRVGKGPGSAERRAAVDALDRVGAADLADKPIGRLSAGQRQRVFIARALVSDPELLLLDEPTTGVDTAAATSFYTLLRQLKETGITVILVTHDIGVVASYVDSVACLNRSLFAHCRPDEVQCTEALRAMYGCDVAYLHHGEAPHIVVEEHK